MLCCASPILFHALFRGLLPGDFQWHRWEGPTGTAQAPRARVTFVKRSETAAGRCRGASPPWLCVRGLCGCKHVGDLCCPCWRWEPALSFPTSPPGKEPKSLLPSVSQGQPRLIDVLLAPGARVQLQQGDKISGLSWGWQHPGDVRAPCSPPAAPARPAAPSSPPCSKTACVGALWPAASRQDWDLCCFTWSTKRN